MDNFKQSGQGGKPHYLNQWSDADSLNSIPQMNRQPVQRINDKLFETDRLIKINSVFRNQLIKQPSNDSLQGKDRRSMSQEQTVQRQINYGTLSDLSDSIGSYRQLRSFPLPQAKVVGDLPEVIQENSLEVSAISNSKNNSGCQTKVKRSNSQTEGVLTGCNNTQDFRESKGGLIDLTIPNGSLVKADEELEFNHRFTSNLPSVEVLSDRTKMLRSHRGTVQISAKQDNESGGLELNCGSHSISTDNQPNPSAVQSKPAVQYFSSVVTTNNNSKHDMLLDHKKIEGTSSNQSIMRAASDINYGSSNQVKSDYPTESQRPFFIPSGVGSEEISRRFPKPQITVSSSRNAIQTGIQTLNSQKNAADSSLSNDLTLNGKSEPICSENQTQRLSSNQNQYLDHSRQATSCFPNKNVENTKSHDVFLANNQADLHLTYNDSFSAKVNPASKPHYKPYGQQLRQVKSFEKPFPIVSTNQSGMEVNMSNSFSNLHGFVGFTSKKSHSQLQYDKNSDIIISKIRLSNQRTRSHEDSQLSPQETHHNAGNIRTSVEEQQRKPYLLIGQQQEIISQDAWLQNLSQPISSDSKFLSLKTGQIKEMTANYQEQELQETYNSQPNKSSGARNQMAQQSWTFNKRHPVIKEQQSDNEIEIWEGERQTDFRQVRDSSFDNQRMSQQIRTNGLILSQSEQNQLKEKQVSQGHSRTNSKQCQVKKAARNEHSSSQLMTQSHSQSQQAATADALHSSMHQSTAQYLNGDSRYMSSMDHHTPAYITSDQALQEVLESGQQFESDHESQAAFLARNSLNSHPLERVSAESEIAQALRSKAVFDLPQALLTISQLNQRVSDLSQQLSQTQYNESWLKERLQTMEHQNKSQKMKLVSQKEKNVKLEQQLIDLIEEKRLIRAQLDAFKLNELKHDPHHGPLIKEITRLQKQIELIQAEKHQKDDWLSSQYNHIGILTSQVERAWSLVGQQKGIDEQDLVSQKTDQVEAFQESQQINTRLLATEDLREENEKLRGINQKLKTKIETAKQDMALVDAKLDKIKGSGYLSQEQTQKKLIEVKRKNESYEDQIQELRSVLGFVFAQMEIQIEGISPDLKLSDFNPHLRKVCSVFKEAIVALKQRVKLSSGYAEREQNILNQLEVERKLKRCLLNRVQEVYGNIRVFCRIRPVLKQEHQLRRSLIKYDIIGHNRLVIQGPSKKAYEFDGIFDSGCSQQDVFDELQSVISSAMNGHNVCIMSYGQTGTGKTYTMVGDDSNPGLYFNTVDEIFRLMNLETAKYDMSASVVEIYNEQIRDMLSKDQQNNEVRLVESNGMTFAQQSRRKITSKNSLLRCLRDAFFNRTNGVTQFNDFSSRSHFILSIQIRQSFKNGSTKTGQLTLVDLAGSERTLKNDANGVRLQEAQNINKSLSTLGKVFMHLRLRMNHIPFRDSKLTHYLRDCIDGEHSKTVVICQMSPLEKDRGESISSLSFGQKAQQIERIPSTNSNHRSQSRGCKRASRSVMSVRSQGGKRSLSLPKRKSVPALCRSMMSIKPTKSMRQFSKIDTSQKRKARVIRTSKKQRKIPLQTPLSPMDCRYFKLREETEFSPPDKLQEVDPRKTSGRQVIKLEMNNRIFEQPHEADSTNTLNDSHVSIIAKAPAQSDLLGELRAVNARLVQIDQKMTRQEKGHHRQ